MRELPVVDQPTHRSGALLDYLARRIRVSAEVVLEPMGLRPRHLVALTVLRDGGPVSQQALASRLLLDGTNVVGLLNELEARALIERRRSPEDRRRHTVELTQDGRELLVRAECALAVAEDDALSALSAAERETLYVLLQRAASVNEPTCVEAAAEPDVR